MGRLDKVEPVNVWQFPRTKTTAWRNSNGGVGHGLGIDSPNLDPETKNKFRGRITQNSIDRAAALPGAKDSGMVVGDHGRAQGRGRVQPRPDGG